MNESPSSPDAVPSARINERLVLEDVTRRMFGAAESHKVQVGRYIVLDAIGSGGMGTVYRAYDPKLKRKVALKVLRADAANGAAARDRLRREAKALARLRHPNVVAVHEVGTHGEEVFIAMAYVESGDLAQWAMDQPAGTPGRRQAALRMLLAAGRGLAAAHRAGLVHGDVKPGNILIGDDGRAAVGDFGLVRTLDDAADGETPASGANYETPRLTVTSGPGGTPLYAAPERHAGRSADARSDQFSFCVAAWEVLFGAPPWLGPPQPARPPKTPSATADAALARVLKVGLRAQPDERHPSMPVLLARLERAAGRRRIATTGIVVGVLACAAAIASWQSGGRCRGEHDPLRGLQRPLPVGIRVAAQSYAQRWRSASEESCRADVSPARAAASLGCLAIQRAQLQGVATVPAATTEALATLEEPSRCRDAHPTATLPRSPTDRDAVLAAVATLAAASTWRTIGEEATARALVAEIPEATLSSHARPAAAATTFAIEGARREGDPERAAELAREAYREANRNHNTRRAAVYAELLAAIAEDAHESVRARLWRRHWTLLQRSR